MPYYDLNVPWAQDEADTQRTLLFLKELGYTIAALTHTLSGKLPSDLSSPIPDPLPFATPKGLHLLRRCTLLLSDTSSNHRLSELTRHYDVLALRPTSIKTVEQACRDLDCDLISFDLTARYEGHFRAKTLMQAVDRQVPLELCYSQAILAADAAVRRTVIGNATAIIRATRGRGIVLSSEAKRVVGCRGPADVINLTTLWGLGPERGRESIDAVPRRLAVTGALKRESFRGVIRVVYGGEKPTPKQDGGKAKGKRNEAAGNGRKRKADDIEDTALSIDKEQQTIAKPPSNRELKRRKKAEEQAKREARMTGDVE